MSENVFKKITFFFVEHSNNSQEYWEVYINDKTGDLVFVCPSLDFAYFCLVRKQQLFSCVLEGRSISECSDIETLELTWVGTFGETEHNFTLTTNKRVVALNVHLSFDVAVFPMYERNIGPLPSGVWFTPVHAKTVCFMKEFLECFGVVKVKARDNTVAVTK